MDKRRQWMALVIEEGLNTKVITAEDILAHATPAVLATDLPPSLVASILEAGMQSTSFNAELLIARLGPTSLADYVPLPLLWGCVDEAAQKIIDSHPLTDRGTEPIVPGPLHSTDDADIEVLEERQL